MDRSRRHAVVVGGGIVGSAQALMLAAIGFRVTVVDASPPAGKQAVIGGGAHEGLSVRTVAISYRSRQLLESFGLSIEHLGCPIHAVKVSDKGHFGSVLFDRRDYSLPALGYVISNAELENHLTNLMQASGVIDIRKPARAELRHHSAERGEIAVTCDSKTEEVAADLLVAADGTQSDMRAQFGIQIKTTDYNQHAFVTNVMCQRNHNNVAFERFTESGPLAILPLDQHIVAVVCALDSDDVNVFRGFSQEELLRELQRRFGGQLGRFQQVGEYAFFPLSLTQACKQVEGCGVLIGNASLTLHPVAGQGLNLAIRDTVELTSQLSKQRNIALALAAFEAARTSDKRFVVRQTDFLAKWFRRHEGSLSRPVKALKTPSLLMLDSLSVARNRFGRKNAGLSIPLSHTARHIDEFDPIK